MVSLLKFNQLLKGKCKAQQKQILRLKRRIELMKDSEVQDEADRLSLIMKNQAQHKTIKKLQFQNLRFSQFNGKES